MAIVNFAIPRTLEERVARVIKEKGFGSKAEFFRFAAIHLIDIIQKPVVSEESRFNYLTKAVSEEISKYYRDKKTPSLRDQLKDL